MTYFETSPLVEWSGLVGISTFWDLADPDMKRREEADRTGKPIAIEWLTPIRAMPVPARPVSHPEPDEA